MWVPARSKGFLSEDKNKHLMEFLGKSDWLTISKKDFYPSLRQSNSVETRVYRKVFGVTFQEFLKF